MKGYLTSYVGLFEPRTDGEPLIHSIEVPLIQRDYAQGRLGAGVGEIRTSFLEVLLDAVADGEPVGLDFVYGNIDGTTFLPLDGQQRLTTLFLLHWYLASLADQLRPDAAWTRLTYATRASARLFCQRLAANPLPKAVDTPSTWITDQPWYLYVWRADPTVQAMLVMLDSIRHVMRRLHPDLDARDAWARLTNPDSPAVSFYVLPLDDMDSDEELYIKMNSRGKPLTPFENFKARFEQDIQHSDRADEFAHRIDGAWSDLLWPYHGGDHIVDDEFVSYIGYITELCELREGWVGRERRLSRRARAVFGSDNVRSREHLDFLFNAFDCWLDANNVSRTLNDVLSVRLPGHTAYDYRKVITFGTVGTDLFGQCLQNRNFFLPQRLYLYAFLIHLIEGTEEFPRRLRVLRNLIAASENEVRRDNMPGLLNDVGAIIRDGDLDVVSRFSGNQVDDERRKERFLTTNPDLADAVFRLEDQPLLQGTLTAFDLDSSTFRHRAAAFEAAFAKPSRWHALTGAILATGEYQRQRPKSGAWQFGTSSSNHPAVWRYLLTEGTRTGLSTVRDVLGRFLDGLAAANTDVESHCLDVSHAWLARREDDLTFDWRYYLVKYPSMRSGDTGLYYGVDGRLGYSMCMLRTQQRNGYYRDPILLEVWSASGVGARVRDPWFSGYETIPRWLRLERSGAGLRSIDQGFELDPPESESHVPVFEAVCERYRVVATDERVVLTVRQRPTHDGAVDCEDRVLVGAAFLTELVKAGL